MNLSPIENYRRIIAEAPFDDDDGDFDLPEEWGEAEIGTADAVTSGAVLPVGNSNLGRYADIGINWTRPALKRFNRAPADLQQAVDCCLNRLKETGHVSYAALRGRQKDGATGRIRVGNARIRVRAGNFGIEILDVILRKEAYR